MARMLGIVGVAVVCLVLAGCGEDDTVSSGAGDGTLVPTTERTEARTVTATPVTAPAGSLVELTFDEESVRGIAWRLEANGVDIRGDQPDDVAGPFVLVAATADHTCVDCPTWYPPGEGGWEDVGISGPGPDVVRIPEVAAPGAWTLCSANAGDPPYCTDLTVVAA